MLFFVAKTLTCVIVKNYTMCWQVVIGIWPFIIKEQNKTKHTNIIPYAVSYSIK